MLKLAVTAPRTHVPPPVLLNEPNNFADFHVPMPLPALPNVMLSGALQRVRSNLS
jgi:hypothetical protein